jgi:hypothetical protein
MRRRERAYFLVLGTISALGLAAGAWPVPLIAFALLELSFTASEHVSAIAGRVTDRSEIALRGYRAEAAGGILSRTP